MEFIKLQTAEGVARLTLNRPEVRNALNLAMIGQLQKKLDEVRRDSKVRCLVLQGEGDHFQTGADVEMLRELLESSAGTGSIPIDLVEAAHEVIRSLHCLPVPVVASVRGSVAGFGVGLMLACDLVVLGEDVKLSLAYPLLGLSPDGGASYFLPQAIGLKKSMELLLLGEFYNAEQLMGMGMGNRVVPVNQLDAEVNSIAAKLASGASRAQKRTKELLLGAHQATLQEQLDREARRIVACGKEPDFAIGLKALIARGKPIFGK